MLIYLLDLTSDVWLAVRYYQNDESKWFASTLSLIIITVVVTNIVACLQAFEDSFEGPCKWLCAFSTCWPVLFRYIEEFTRWNEAKLDGSACEEHNKDCTCDECKKHLEKKRNLAKSTYSLAWLHLIQTLIQSGPQFCLQFYIMLNEWNFPWLTVLSSLVSLVSLLWCITALEQARESKNGRHFETGSAILFSTWQLFAIISRLSAIVIFAYILQYHVFLVLLFHWLVVTIAIAIHRKDEFKEDSKVEAKTWIFMFIFSFVFAYPLLLFASEPLLAFYKNRKLHTFIASTVLAVENTIMLAVSIGVSKFAELIIVDNMNVLFPVTTACVLGGIVLQTAFCAGFYKCCCRKSTDENHTDTTETAGETANNPGASVENSGFNQC